MKHLTLAAAVALALVTSGWFAAQALEARRAGRSEPDVARAAVTAAGTLRTATARATEAGSLILQSMFGHMHRDNAQSCRVCFLSVSQAKVHSRR